MTFLVAEYWVLLNLHLRIRNRNIASISIDGLQSYCMVLFHKTLKIEGMCNKIVSTDIQMTNVFEAKYIL
jgi:hypothetical protein